jgi:hypothetical protein
MLVTWAGHKLSTGNSGPSPSTMKIASDTPLVVVGPSIQNVVNTRAPRMWLMASSGGHFYPTPGTAVACVGAACATAEGAVGTSAGNANNYYEEPLRLALVMNQLGDPSARGRCLVFYDAGPNDLGKTGVTSQKLIDALDRWIERVTSAGHMIAIPGICQSGGTATPGAGATQRADYNAAVAARHDPANGVFACLSRLAAFDPDYATLTYDNLHPNADGARIIGAADWLDLSEFADFAGSPWTDASTYVNPFGQSSNSKGSFAGTGGTLTAGQVTGTVATGWTVNCNQSGLTTAGTAATGVTCTATAGGTETITVNGKSITVNKQIIRVTGTASSIGYALLWGAIVKGTAAAQYFNWGEFGQSQVLCRLYGATKGTAPSGIRGLGSQYGVLGNAMNRTIETNAGLIGADTGIINLRTVPIQALNLQGTQNFSVGFSWSSGATVDATLEIYQMTAAQVETVAYAAPFNLTQAFVANGATNPLQTRPDMSGTKAAGNSLTMQSACMSGGGVGLYGTSVIKDATDATIATFTNTQTPATFPLTATETGKTLRLTATGSNSFGSFSIEGPAYTIG